MVSPKDILINNFWLKLLALVLAVITWFYVEGELTTGTAEKKAAFLSIFPYKMTSKMLPVEVQLVGKPVVGFRVDEENVTVKPKLCMIIGPEQMIKEIASVRTVPVDVTEYTKPIVKKVQLAPIARGIMLEEEMVEVNIPIVKIEENKER